jgi:hypothetical protein
MQMSNKMYDILKWIALVALDAIGLFYSTMSSIWGLPFGDQVLATCTATSLLIGALIGISSIQYKKKESVADEH